MFRAVRKGLWAVFLLLFFGSMFATAACGEDEPSGPVGVPGPSAPRASGGSPSAAPAEPKTVEAATVAIQRTLDAFAAGDWGGTWDEWNAEGKAAMSRNDYVQMKNECKAVSGPQFKIVNARLEGNIAVFQLERLSFGFTNRMVYESNAWKFAPEPELLEQYRAGAAVMIAKCRAEATA